MKILMAGCLAVLLSLGSSGCLLRPKPDLNQITLWHWMADRQQAFETLASRYEQQTGLKVKINLYTPSAYTQKIIASAQGHVLPDIYGILDEKEMFASFIKAGYVEDLTDDFAEDDGAWQRQLFDEALDGNRFSEGNSYDVQPGLYGVPIDVSTIQMVYNKRILRKAGVTEPPGTFEEFLAAAEKISALGIPVLVSGWGELWMMECFASNYAFNIMGEEKIMETYQGHIPYTDSDWIKVFEVFERLAVQKVFMDGIVIKPNKQAEQDFALERAAFAFNGSWCVNVYHGMNPDLDYGTMLPPAMEGALPMRVWGGAGSFFVVNRESDRKDKAIAFLKWLTSPEQQAYLAQETRNLPSNREALKDIPEVLSGFASAMDRATHPSLWPYNEHVLVTDAMTKGIQSIIIGEKTARQVAEEVNQVKQRVLEKAQ